jgi:hypothetical protein
MNIAFSQNLAEQCRALLAGVHAPDVRDQLEMWIIELGAPAEVLVGPVNTGGDAPSAETGGNLNPV